MDPETYEGLKNEAYVQGAGNPNPAVITFTTETSTMAINELIHRIQGFRGLQGSWPNRVRNFYSPEDRKPGVLQRECQLCEKKTLHGRGDCTPLLDGAYVA